MKREYLKYDKIVRLLNSGYEIFTDRGFGGAPYTPLFFGLYDLKGKKKGNIHHMTMKSLINNKVITDKYGEKKYSLIK